MVAASFMSKRSRIFRIFVGLTAVCASAAISITPATARAERTLALDEALAIAHRNNRDLRAARARIAQAHAGVLTAWSALLPIATAQGKYTHNYREVTLDFTIPGL